MSSSAPLDGHVLIADPVTLHLNDGFGASSIVAPEVFSILVEDEEPIIGSMPGINALSLFSATNDQNSTAVLKMTSLEDNNYSFIAQSVGSVRLTFKADVMKNYMDTNQKVHVTIEVPVAVVD